MPLFLSQVAYNEEGWQALVSNPQNRLEAIRPVVDKLGGRIVNAYFAFGDYDFILISEFPNNVTAAALAIAAAAGGAVKSIKTTPLMEQPRALRPSARPPVPAIALRPAHGPLALSSGSRTSNSAAWQGILRLRDALPLVGQASACLSLLILLAEPETDRLKPVLLVRRRLPQLPRFGIFREVIHIRKVTTQELPTRHARRTDPVCHR